MASRWATPTAEEPARDKPAPFTSTTPNSTTPTSSKAAAPLVAPPIKHAAHLAGLGSPTALPPTLRTVSQPRPADAPPPEKDDDGWYKAPTPPSAPAQEAGVQPKLATSGGLSPAAASFTPAPPAPAAAPAEQGTDRSATRQPNQSQPRRSTQTSRWATQSPDDEPNNTSSHHTPSSIRQDSPHAGPPPSAPKGPRNSRGPAQSRKPSGGSQPSASPSKKVSHPRVAVSDAVQHEPTAETSSSHPPSLLSRLSPAPPSTESPTGPATSAPAPPTARATSNKTDTAKPPRRQRGPSPAAKSTPPAGPGASGNRPARNAGKATLAAQQPEKTHKLSAAELDEVMAVRRKANEDAKAKADRRQRDLEAYAAQASAEDTERKRLAEAKRAHVEEQRQVDAERKATEAQASRAKKERDAKLQAEIDSERAENARRKMAAKEGRAWDTEKVRENGEWASPSRGAQSEQLGTTGSRWDRVESAEEDRITADQQRVNAPGYRPTADDDCKWDSVP